MSLYQLQIEDGEMVHVEASDFGTAVAAANRHWMKDCDAEEPLPVILAIVLLDDGQVIR